MLDDLLLVCAGFYIGVVWALIFTGFFNDL